MPRDQNCELCSLHASSKHVCIWGKGSGKGFVVGEAPGKEEAKTGEPFRGRAGQFGRPILAEFGLEDPYITNAAKCRPPENRKPEPAELKVCGQYLAEEIETKKPKAILLWGAVAMKACIGKTKITEMNGQVVEKNGQTYVCCFHPAAILRDLSKLPAFKMAIKRYADVLNGTFSNELPAWKALDKSTLDEFIADWIAAKTIAFDTETTGLEWWVEDFKINSIQFSLHNGKTEKNWALPLAKWPVLDFDDQKLLLTELTRTTGGKTMIATNGKYDNHCLMRVYGVKFRLDSDAGLAHHLTDENAHHSLKSMARELLGAPDYDIPLKEKLGNGVSQKKFFGYGCADSAYTRRLDPILTKRMDEQEEWLYRKVVMPAARAFEEIEQNGLYVDIKRLNQVVDEEEAKHSQALKQLNKMAGQVINWNSPSQVAEILYGKMGLTPTVFTDKNNPSTGEEAIIGLDHPIGKLLTEYREHEKYLSTYTGRRDEDGNYFGGWRDFMVGPHLYLSTNLHGTVTGRYSSRLHQVPRDGTIRNAVIAPPGWTHFQMDIDQAELKVIAIVAREQVMLEIFKQGKDIHWTTLMNAVESGGGEYVDAVYKTARHLTKRKLDFPSAIAMLRDMDHDEAIELVPDWKEGRKKAKGINFGFVYDQSPAGFITYAKTKYGFEPTLPEATQFHETFFQTYPGLTPWHDRQRKLARQDGFVRNLAGRKRRLPGIYSENKSIVAEAERQAINAPIQGFIGDYKAMILVELNETIPKTHMRITGEVHDAILGWVKNEHINEVIPEVKRIGDNPRLARECGLNFPIPITASVDVGAWGAGKKWKGTK